VFPPRGATLGRRGVELADCLNRRATLSEHSFIRIKFARDEALLVSRLLPIALRLLLVPLCFFAAPIFPGPLAILSKGLAVFCVHRLRYANAVRPHIPGTFWRLSLCRPSSSPLPEEKKNALMPRPCSEKNFIIVNSRILGNKKAPGRNYEGYPRGLQLMPSADEYYEYGRAVHRTSLEVRCSPAIRARLLQNGKRHGAKLARKAGCQPEMIPSQRNPP